MKKVLIKNPIFWSELEGRILSSDAVDLSGLEIDEKQFEDRILPMLKKHPGIRTLNLTDNNLGDSGTTDWGVKLLADFLKENRSIVAVHLDNNDVGQQGAGWLLGALEQNHALMALTLTGKVYGRAILPTQEERINDCLRRNQAPPRKAFEPAQAPALVALSISIVSSAPPAPAEAKSASSHCCCIL